MSKTYVHVHTPDARDFCQQVQQNTAEEDVQNL